MNKDQAVQFINAVNVLLPYCPPILFDRVATSSVLQTVLMVANGQLELAPKTPPHLVQETKEGA